jgi:hypothetical protein
LSSKQVRELLEKLTAFINKLCEDWRSLHGQF